MCHPQVHPIYQMVAEWLLYVASPVSKGSSPVGWVIIQINVGDVSHSNWICCGYEGPLYTVHDICLYSLGRLLDTSPLLQVRLDGHVAPMDTSPSEKWTLRPR